MDSESTQTPETTTSTERKITSDNDSFTPEKQAMDEQAPPEQQQQPPIVKKVKEGSRKIRKRYGEREEFSTPNEQNISKEETDRMVNEQMEENQSKIKPFAVL